MNNGPRVDMSQAAMSRGRPLCKIDQNATAAIAQVFVASLFYRSSVLYKEHGRRVLIGTQELNLYLVFSPLLATFDAL